MIERRLENLLALDYPAERSRSSSRPTRPPTEPTSSSRRSRRVSRACGSSAARAAARSPLRTAPSARPRRDPRVLGCERAMAAGRAAQARPQLRRSRRRLRLRRALLRGGRRDEPRGHVLALREPGCAATSPELGSITGGIGPIYTVRRTDYVDVDPRFGHDLALPYLMVQHGRRAVFEPEALSPGRNRRATTRTSTGARCACSSTAG